MHTRMELELLKYINVDMKWNILKKVRTSMTKRPRKLGADGSELVYNIEEPAAFETKKSGILKIVDTPLKKRRLVHPFPSPPPQTLCVNGEEGLSPGPQTPSVHHEDSGQRCWSSSLSQSQKSKSKTGSRNSKQSKPRRKDFLNLDDFSGIELLAAAACSTFIHDNADHVDDFSMMKEKATPAVYSSTVDIKEAIISSESNGSSVQYDMVPDGNEGVGTRVAPSKEFRLHWDLNTVMDDWEEPCDDSPVKSYDGAGVVVVEERSMLDSVFENQISVKHEAAVSTVPCSMGKAHEPTEDLICSQEVVGTKATTGKTSDIENSASKSDVVDLLIHSGKCEDFSTSTASALHEEIIVTDDLETINISKFDRLPVSEVVVQLGCQSPKLCKSYCDNKVISEDPLSECCGSNVTQDEQGHMAEGDSEDKLQVGYDSPFEDGELREPIEKVDICYESDNVYKDDFGSIENSESDKVERIPNDGQTMEDQCSLLVKEITPNNDIKQDAQVHALKKPRIDESGRDVCESKDGLDNESRPVGGDLLHIDASSSFGVCKNDEYIRQSRSGNNGEYSRTGRDLGAPVINSSLRVWNLKSHRSSDSNYPRNYNPRDGCRTQNRRQSPSERNNGYSTNRGPPARSHSRDRYRGGSGFHSQEYHDHRSCYSERKLRFSPSFNRPRSRSRSGSPIAWHFQKHKNLDNMSYSGETEAMTRTHVSPERSSKCFDDRRFRDCLVRDKRQSPVTIMQRNERFEPNGYPERLKSDDHFWFTQRPARFSQMTGHKYKDGSDAIRKLDGHYEKMNRVGRSDDDGGMRRFKVIPESKKLGERY